MIKNTQSIRVNTQEREYPTLRDVYPQWGILSDKLQNLCRREDEILTRINAIDAEQSRRNAIFFQEPSVSTTLPPKPKPPISARVKALLGDIEPPPNPLPIEPADPKLEYSRPGDEELATLSRELTDIQGAKEIIHPMLAAAHYEGSKAVCESRIDEYRHVAARVCAALISLGDALVSHDSFTSELGKQGVDWCHFRPVDTDVIKRVVGDPKEGNSPVRRALAWAAEGGHFDLTSLPATWARSRV